MSPGDNFITDTFRISSYDLDPNNRARLTAIASFFQEMAYRHAGMLGFGFDDMKRNDTFWVLARMKIRMDRYPVWDDEVKVKTWHRGMDRLFGLRDFILSDLSGEQLGIGSTAWLILDRQTRRPVREISDSLLGTIGKDSVFNGGLDKIRLPEELEPLAHRKVLYSDLDLVGHVNNVKYMEWCIDLVRADVQETRKIRELEINFTHEALLNDEVAISGHIDRESGSYILATSVSDNREIFRARLDWLDGNQNQKENPS